MDKIAPGLRDELITDDVASAIAELNEDRILVDRLVASDAVERLGRHLLRVARRLSIPNDQASVPATIDSVNRAIDALGEEFAGDRISHRVEVLKGVRSTTGLAADALPAHPMIPLITSELLVNGKNEPNLAKVLSEEIRCSDQVDLVCAFVGYSGLGHLRDDFRKLLDRGGRLRVITSTYLGSTSDKAVDELAGMGAVVKVNYAGESTKLHAKAWLFRRPGELDTAFIGSSNLSTAALVSGAEWNVRLARADAPSVFHRIQQTFDAYWNDPKFETYVHADRERLRGALATAKGYAASGFSKTAQTEIDQLEHELALAYAELALTPKPHQLQVLETLALRRSQFGEHEHLVVAATGTGKTVIAALDYARLCPETGPRPPLLFVAHREQILQQARRTFRKALRDPNFGEILGGDADQIVAGTHIFAMVQTLHGRLATTATNAFDVIYIDEAHHGTASTWNDVIRHFDPVEMVGLTATPERTDGTSVADLFGGLYTTELRLWEAVEDQLLAPFEYVGVDDGTDLTDLAWHGGAYATGELATLYTGDHGRVTRIVEAIHQWVEKPAQMKALGFCVNISHAQFMTEQFVKHGFKAAVLTGADDQARRESVLASLRQGALQAVFSVDVLGEGVDVPDVDTLLLVRPTQSPVLFAQQLGRGLRTAPGKTSCLVLDFVGQHRAEYRYEERLRALVDLKKGTVLDQATDEFPFLPAGCTITMEQIVRERVLAALKQAAKSTGQVSLTKDLVALGSLTLSAFLQDTGRTLKEFYKTDGRKFSWTRLQRRAKSPSAPAEPETQALRDLEEQLLRRMSYLQHVADSQRQNAWFDWLTGNEAPDTAAFSDVEQRLAMQLFHLLAYAPASLDQAFAELWALPAVRAEISELLTLTHLGLDASPIPLLGLPDVPLMAHARYTRAEVFAAMGVSTIAAPKEHREGVYFAADAATQLMFVTLNKDTTRFSSTTQYRDHAITADLFHWESPNSWRQTSPAMKRCIGEGEDSSHYRLLFVRESSIGPIEGTFRCYGFVDLAGEMEGDRPVALTWKLRTPLPQVVLEASQLVVAS